MYSSILLIRRFIFVLLCIALQSVQSRIPIGILLAFQVLYLAFIVFSKSYKEMIANIIEIFNELFFIVLFGSLLIFNAESDWSEVVIYIYMQLILLNTVICFILFLIYFIREIWIKLTMKRKKIRPTQKCDQMASMEQMLNISQRKVLKAPYPKIKISTLEERKEESKLEEYDNHGTMIRTVGNPNQADFNLNH